jgi:hypothetical protein
VNTVDNRFHVRRAAAKLDDCRAASAGDNCLLFDALGSREFSRGITRDDKDGTKNVIA